MSTALDNLLQQLVALQPPLWPTDAAVWASFAEQRQTLVTELLALAPIPEPYRQLVVDHVALMQTAIASLAAQQELRRQEILRTQRARRRLQQQPRPYTGQALHQIG